MPVTLEQMVYHTQCVARGNRTVWGVRDLPFGSYQQSREQTLRGATALIEAGAHMVKLEGGGWTIETVRFLVERGIWVCAHLGLTPRSVHELGGYRIQGRTESAAAVLKQQAKELAEVEAAMLVLELVPSVLARKVTAALPISVIGIGAGVGCRALCATSWRAAHRCRQQSNATLTTSRRDAFRPMHCTATE